MIINILATNEEMFPNSDNRRFDTACSDNAGLIGREDQPIHFDAGSQRELGRRYVQKLLAINAWGQFPPTLSYTLTPGHLSVSWPANCMGWLLQTQTNSSSSGLGTGWITITASATTNRLQFPMGLGSGNTYFRLRSP